MRTKITGGLILDMLADVPRSLGQIQALECSSTPYDFNNAMAGSLEGWVVEVTQNVSGSSSGDDQLFDHRLQ